MDIFEVVITRQAEKQLRKIPSHVALKLAAWVDGVKHNGLMETRKLPGFHDEPLYGKRKSERSIRLSKSYRAFYVVAKDGSIHVAKVMEVNKHEY